MGGVPIGADRDPTPDEFRQMISATCAAFRGGPTSVLIHRKWPRPRSASAIVACVQASRAAAGKASGSTIQRPSGRFHSVGPRGYAAHGWSGST